MDHSNVDVGIKQDENGANSSFDSYVVEDGKRYRVPYRMIKMVTFTNVDRQELIDIPHAARLQYRLMLLEPVIKARVDFTKSKITVIYNHREADNIREKMSLEELEEFLLKQGVRVSAEHTVVEDYDYYRSFYSYAYNPPSIREHPPYGYNMEQWKAMKDRWDRKMEEGEREKYENFKKFQESYLEDNPEIASKIVEGYKPNVTAKKADTVFGRIFGNKKKKNEKGFWFHGI